MATVLGNEKRETGVGREDKQARGETREIYPKTHSAPLQGIPINSKKYGAEEHGTQPTLLAGDQLFGLGFSEYQPKRRAAPFPHIRKP
jgi:hypothetical protein